jgi:hypothetical protein
METTNHSHEINVARGNIVIGRSSWEHQVVFGYSPVPHKLKGKLLPGLDGEIEDRFGSGWHAMVWSTRNGRG